MHRLTQPILINDIQQIACTSTFFFQMLFECKSLTLMVGFSRFAMARACFFSHGSLSMVTSQLSPPSLEVGGSPFCQCCWQREQIHACVSATAIRDVAVAGFSFGRMTILNHLVANDSRFWMEKLRDGLLDGCLIGKFLCIHFQFSCCCAIGGESPLTSDSRHFPVSPSSPAIEELLIMKCEV